MRTTAVILFCYLLPYGMAAAQDLASVYRQAIASDPVWLGQLASNKAARETSVQSRAALLPSVSLFGESLREHRDSNTNLAFSSGSDTYNTNRWSLDLRQPIFNYTSFQAHEQAQAIVRQADAQLEADRQTLIVRVTQVYFDVLAREVELESVRAEKKAAERQLDQARKRFDVGLIAITDVHEAQANYDLVIAREIEAENARSLALSALAEITGTSHEKLSDIKGELQLMSPDPQDVEQWVNTALENNRALAAAIAGVEAAQENVQAQRGGHYPVLDLVASTGNSDSNGNTFGNDTDSSSIGVQLNVPLYSGGGTSSRVRQAIAELDQAHQFNIQTRRATEKLTRDAYRNTVAAISRVRALNQAVISAQSAVDATEAGFEVGTRTIVDVLNAQRNLYSARSDYQQARYSYLINGLLLKQAAGSLSEKDVITLNLLLDQQG